MRRGIYWILVITFAHSNSCWVDYFDYLAPFLSAGMMLRCEGCNCLHGDAAQERPASITHLMRVIGWIKLRMRLSLNLASVISAPGRF
jgi:hypothetical protein